MKFRSLQATLAFSVLIQGAGIGTGLLSSRALGPQGKGELTTVLLWTSTMLYLGTVGLSEATAYFAAKERSRLPTVFATSTALAIALGILVTAVGWWVLPVVLAGRGPLLELSRWFLVLYAIPGFLSLCSVAFLQGSSRWRWFNVSRSAVHLVTFGVMAAVWLNGAASVTTFAGAYLIGNAVPPLLAFTGIWLARDWSWRPSPPMARAIMVYGLRVQAGTWSSMANARVDQLLMSIFFPAATLGVYVVAVTYVTAVNLLPATVAQVSLPALVTAHQAGNAAHALARIFRWNLWLTVLASVGLGIGSRWLVPWLFGNRFAPAIAMADILLVAAPVFASNMVLSAAFKACGQPGVASQAEAVGLVATAALLALLLPKWGGLGAALASVCAYSVTNGFLVWMACRRLGVVPLQLVLPQTEDWRAARYLLSR